MPNNWIDKHGQFTAIPRYAVEIVKNRQEYLCKYTGRNYDESVFPFHHAVARIKDSWYKDQWLLDPLIIPLLRFMNTIEGIETISSCQGRNVMSPHVYFNADEEAVYKLNQEFNLWHDKINEGWQWNEMIVHYSERNIKTKKAQWDLYFYDVLSLIKFTAEYLGVPLEKQIHSDDIEIMLRDPSKTQSTVSIDELREIIWRKPV